jgi:hypothetical protein
VLDYGAFCYLDVEKTGSSFVRQFLRRHVAIRERDGSKHKPAGWSFGEPADKFFFISCRSPLSSYESLYRYGMEGRGGLHDRISAIAAMDNIYDGSPEGFARWLRFVLDPASHGRIARSFGRRQARIYGLMTHRFLRLSFRFGDLRCRMLGSREQVLTSYHARKLHSAIVHNENLAGDLAEVVRGHLTPYLRDVDSALTELSGEVERVNISTQSVDFSAALEDPGLLQLLVEREWFFYDQLGYERPVV